MNYIVRTASIAFILLLGAPIGRADFIRETESVSSHSTDQHVTPVAEGEKTPFAPKAVEWEPKPYDATFSNSRFHVQALAVSGDYGTLIYGICSFVGVGELRQLVYATPAYYRSGYVYTAVLEPLSGDPDLYLHERVNGTWRMLRRSWNSGLALDSFSFTRADLTSTATNVDLDAKGYTAATFNFYLFEKPIPTQTGFMQFPLRNGWTPYTARMTAVLDHSMTTGGNCADNKVLTYTNEVGLMQYGSSSWSTVNVSASNCSNGSNRLYGFRNATSTKFSVNGQFDGTANSEYGKFIFYDGHTGYDYPVLDGTPVYPVANGKAYLYSDGLRVDHPNGYTTYYLHLSAEYFSNGQSVTTNDMIGRTGNGHLHLTVMKGTERADPYGWKGPAGQDPLKVGGRDNVCLWLTCQ